MSMASKRNSLSLPKPAVTTESTHYLKHRVITCINKLSDRDTLAVATIELESIARSLSKEYFSTFLNCIYNTDSSSKSPVRKQCVHLLTLLSHFHGDALSPFLSKMISIVLRRLRDHDSAIRSACVDAVSTMSSQITKPPFSVFLKPFMLTLTLEKDFNSQIGSALCLAAAIESAPQPEVEVLLKCTLPRLGKLAKNEGFKAKAALLVLIGSVVGVGGASSRVILDWLVPCLVEFLSNEDWTVRKAAAEALEKVASVEKDLASQYKSLCLNSFQNRRFDKVKVVRETMNSTLDMWKEIPAASEEVIAATKSKSPSIGLDNDAGRCATKSSAAVGFKSPQQKKSCPNEQTHYHREVENSVSKSPSSNMACEDNIKGGDFGNPKSVHNENSGISRPEIKRVLFSRTSDDKVRKSGGLGYGSRVVPFHDYKDPNNATEAVLEIPQDFEVLSLIHEKLLQIEKQQYTLLDLLQRFIGTSQSVMNSLETRVHGLEMTLEGKSPDLALSSGRIHYSDSTENTCYKLPGADFLSSKFWRKSEGPYSTSRLSPGSIQSSNAMRNARDKYVSIEVCTSNSKTFHPHS
ncbi:microtubule-associated protein TORTIFOLIA1 [Quillaja saponaria]|uniref:Microtubule-associated protein TORTIFOLIA1 n=1 Tax=Quillaja saponaria TaxID=32244 RepID=A0AAD7KPE4_QUISA|nr:microtubule-associated protein TORTIFOLIA1 [Quillaja saponaria]